MQKYAKADAFEVRLGQRGGEDGCESVTWSEDLQLLMLSDVHIWVCLTMLEKP